MKNNIKLEIWHISTICAFIIFLLFILARNNVFPDNNFTHILASKYTALISIIFIFVGYYISKIDNETNNEKPTDDPTPGLGEKKNFLYQNNSENSNDYGGSGD